MGYSPWSHKESDTTEQLTHTYTHTAQLALIALFFFFPSFFEVRVKRLKTGSYFYLSISGLYFLILLELF